MLRPRLRFRLTLLSVVVSLAGALFASLIAPQSAAAATGDDAMIFGILQGAIAAEAPDLGPRSGALSVPAGEPALSVVGIGSRDFAVRVSCQLAAASETSSADCGIAFRHNAGGQSLLITIAANGRWTYGRTGEEPVQSGETNASSNDAGGTVTVELFAIGLTGYAGLNGSYLATLDLSLIPSGGPIAIGGGFASGGSRSAYQLAFQDLSIWSFDDVVESAVPLEGAFSPEAQFDAVLEAITASDPIAGPQEGLLFHTEGQATFSRTGVEVSDALVHLECSPPSESVELWDCGIVFRLGEAVDDQFRLIFLSSGRWILARGANTTIQDGVFEPQPGASGPPLRVDLVAAGDTGWLCINGTFAGPLDLSLIGNPGDIAAASAFFASTNVPGGSTGYQQFAVWNADPDVIGPLLAPRPAGTPAPVDPAHDSHARLFALLLTSVTAAPPAFGPESGVLTHDPLAITLLSSSLQVDNLAARLQCVAPQDSGSRLWDCGIVWRSNGPDTQLRLAVVSDGFWSLRSGVAEVLAEGSGLSIDNTPGALLTLDLLALGNSGFFAVNNTFVARLDLASISGAGDVMAGTAFFNESFANGGTTGYDQFSVWPITLQTSPPAVAATPPPAPASSTPVVPAATPVESPVPAPPSPVAAGTPAPLEDIRAIEPANQARAMIEPVEGQEIHGYGVVSRVARSIEVTILIANSRPGDRVVLQSGSCDSLSTDPQGRETAGVLNPQGVIVTTLPLRLTELLNSDAYSLVVYSAADPLSTSPLACGELVAE